MRDRERKTGPRFFKTGTLRRRRLRITAAGNRSIVVWAGPDDQLEIARQLLGSSEKTTTIELVPVNGASVAKVIGPLKELFADAKSSSFFFEADTTRNAILVKGTPEQITELKAALKLLVQGGRCESRVDPTDRP